MKSIRDLYGSHIAELCFIIGPGPSIAKAERYLMEKHPKSFRIALNSAITKIPAEYWFWIDGIVYQDWRDHPHAKAAKQCGVENSKHLYGEEVYVWEPAKKLPDDVQNLKLLHRGTSLIGAMSLACLLGASRIVTVGCDHRFSDAYLKAKQAEVNREGRNDDMAKIKDYYASTVLRINRALNEMPFWLPDWVTVRDASHHDGLDGELPLLKTTIHKEFEMLDRFYQKRGDVA